MSSARIKRITRISSRSANAVNASEETPSACLVQRSRVREDKNILKQDLFLVGKEVTVGRSPDSTVVLKSIDISRRHAVFSLQNDGTWSVQDSRSSNGVYVNEKKLELNETVVLKDGDAVHFGPPDITSFEYVFFYLTAPKESQASCSSAGIVISYSTDHESRGSELAYSVTNVQATSPPAVPLVQTSFAQISSSIHSEQTNSGDGFSGSLHRASNLPCSIQDGQVTGSLIINTGGKRETDVEETAKSVTPSSASDANSDSPELRRRLKELEDMLKEKEKIQLALQESLEEKMKELQKLKTSENTSVEEGTGASNGPPEVQELDHAPEPVMEIIIDDEVSEVITDEPEEVKMQNDKPTAPDIKESFEKVLDSELTCAICSELFVQAITLQCSHTFCAFCLSQWKLNKKICPICRGKIITETRSLVLDNFIDRMTENLGQEAKKRRQALLEERKNSRKQKGSSVSSPIIIDGNGRLGATNTRASTSAANATIVVSSDSESESSSFGPDESDFDSDSSVEGHPDAYYGGYGFCFSCGRRGHWAPGCPF